ncbi:DUF302 domain-containing protein [Falsiruegeria mediterranea]|uniref:DUF302 domain-containing protein n=1 Tax=Falsiruegeria mediterranea M17 TaxID=1200281 RepID=A0A2R8CF56_9RHOB|nr:DUF302 domain-containing protein [Falsiruegeria mediterranea]SPJ31026.1 hypothetical protein TRM7615_04565 [Falsiruegeria mediterranea M17]
MTIHRHMLVGAFVSSLFMIEATAQQTVQYQVDQNAEAVQRAVEAAGLDAIVAIDHARLAAAEGVEMPASRVQVFSDTELNTAILSQNIRAGLDLPLRVLSFDERAEATVMYTDFAFLGKRHGLNSSELADAFTAKMDSALATIEAIAAPIQGLTENYGVLELTSAHGHPETIERLRAAVMSQGDTVWFGEMDFTQEAKALGHDLGPATLLLFGGPAPGGVAMAEFPAIGLDAFCQKLLVYEGPDGSVRVIYNDIAALAQLHYGQTTKPHHQLNERLTATFSKAVE